MILSKLNWRVLSALFLSVLRGSTFSLHQWNGNTTYYALQTSVRMWWILQLRVKIYGSSETVNLLMLFQCDINPKHLETNSCSDAIHSEKVEQQSFSNFSSYI